jgi:hypothetical protein
MKPGHLLKGHNYIRMHQNSCAILEQVHLGIIGIVAISQMNRRVSRGLSRHAKQKVTITVGKKPWTILDDLTKSHISCGSMERCWVTVGIFI